jgi:hypothetical protein
MEEGEEGDLPDTYIKVIFLHSSKMNVHSHPDVPETRTKVPRKKRSITKDQKVFLSNFKY